MALFHDFVVITSKGSVGIPHKTLLVSDGSSDDMKLEEESVFNARAQFSVEHAPNGTVHIKSCYNNKYWTWVEKRAIKAIAKERVEGVSAENCTLLKPKFEGGDKVSFIHVQTGNTGVFEGGVNVFNLNYVNPATLFKMPKRVAFKGLCNGKFLTVEFKYLLRFADADYTALKAISVVRQTNNGDIQVQNWDSKLWWKWKLILETYNEITAFEPYVSEDDASTLFEVIKTEEDNVVMLRCRGNGLFCGPDNGRIPGIVASSPTGTKETRIEVVEPLISRKITVHKADFNLIRANTYKHDKDMVLDYSEIDNGGSQNIVREITLQKEVTESNTWKKGESTMKDTSIKFSAPIPKLGINLEYTFDSENSEEHEWSKTKEEKRTISHKDTITVPPGKKVKAFLKASCASFEVPFSYTQTDRYVTSEDPVTTYVDDGIFTGSNYYHSYFKTEEFPL